METPAQLNMFRIMSWNIGSFVFLKYGKYFGGITGNQHEYFQPNLNGDLVSNTIKNINPDFLYLQEFWFTEDAEKIDFLKEYPHRVFLDMWYRKSGALIAGKKPFSQKLIQDFHIITCENFTIVPVHLNSFNFSKRLEEINKLCEVLSTMTHPTILLGDTNIWSRKNKFLFSKDKQGYLKLIEFFVDASKNIASTTFYGFGLDKIFISKDVAIETIISPKIRGRFMDHYPIYIDAKY